MALRAIVFDLDDTLTDYRGHEADVWAAAARDVIATHPEVDFDTLTDRHRANLEPLWERLLAKDIDLDTYQRTRLTDALAPWSIDPSDALIATYVQHKQRFNHEVWPGPNAAAAVQAAKDRGLRTAILTNGLIEPQKAKLERLQISVDALVTSEEIGAQKPQRAAFAAVEERLDLQPHELAMVGDNPVNDIAGALAAGWAYAVLVRSDTRPPDLPEQALCAADALDAMRLLSKT